MIKVGADDDIFIFQDRITAFEYAHNVFTMIFQSVHCNVEVDLLFSVQCEGIQLGICARSIEDLRRSEFFALENRVGHFQSGCNRWNTWTRRRGLKFHDLIRRSIQCGSATSELDDSTRSGESAPAGAACV